MDIKKTGNSCLKSGNNLSKLCDLGLVGFPENIQKRRRNCGFPFNIFLPHCCGQDQIAT